MLKISAFRSSSCLYLQGVPCNAPLHVKYSITWSLRQKRGFSNPTQRDYAHLQSPYYGLKINQERLWDDIHHTCQWGRGERWGDGPNDTGMSRLSLSAADKEARDWFVETTKELGCKVTVDAMGNIFAVRPGRKAGPPTCAGSHLDTQPTGGRYDGILGVCAGVEMLKVLNDERIETEYSVGVINWTNEEGARFPISMISSGVWAGSIPLERAHNLKEVGEGDRTMKQELERIGYLGETEASYKAMPIAAHFELHIEQGPHLESKAQRIGIVQGVQAYRWYTITVTGRDSHTGTTDFVHRADALLTACNLIRTSRRIACKHSALASTGIVKVSPGSVNTVPGKVVFSLDIRAAEDDRLMRLELDLKKSCCSIARAGSRVPGSEKPHALNRCKVDWHLDAPSPAVKFHVDCIACVEQSSGDLFGDHMTALTSRLTSGHDSVFTSKRVPTSMIFVPCKDGVSHNSREYCAPEDCANGSQVLMGAVLRYDQLRKSRANL